MNWKIKASSQQLLSHLPCGQRLNYFAQRHLTRSLPIDEKTFLHMVEVGRNHFEKFLEWRTLGMHPAEARFYEFGAGWDLVIPLSFYHFGVNDQTVVDVQRLANRQLVNESLQKFRDHGGEIKRQFSRERNGDTVLSRSGFVDELARELGIKYRAPMNVSSTEFEGGSFDFITSTHTMEHVPGRDLPPLLSGCRRLLKEGGVMSLLIDYQDHYSYSHDKVSAYNFLRYTDAQWRMYNSTLHYQNRLRHKDYIQLIQQAGFEVLEDSHQVPEDEDMAAIRAIPLAPGFQAAYTWKELAIRQSHVVLRK